MTPAQKNRIILALKRRKHTVGFLGDGINDAPALHAADVGISVDGAVDVAKESADLILLERDLAVLRDGVLEGRRTLGNIIKYILMGTSSNFGNMFSMAGAAVLLPFLPMLPIQILVNNFLYDLSEVPIPTDTVDDEYIRRPHRWDMSFIRRFMMTMGPVSSVFDFLTFFVLFKVLGAGEGLFQTGWFMESLATQALVIFVIRTRGNPLRSRPSVPLAVTSILVVLTGCILPFTPLGQDARLRGSAPDLVRRPRGDGARVPGCRSGREGLVLSARQARVSAAPQFLRGRARDRPERPGNRAGTLRDGPSDHEESGCSSATIVFGPDARGRSRPSRPSRPAGCASGRPRGSR